MAGDAPPMPGDAPTKPGDAPTKPGDAPTKPGNAPTKPGDAPATAAPPAALDDSDDLEPEELDALRSEEVRAALTADLNHELGADGLARRARWFVVGVTLLVVVGLLALAAHALLSGPFGRP